MPRNYKFHVIALSAICGLIIVVYITMLPKATTQSAGDNANQRMIQIESATWGDNCNSVIQKELQDRQFKPAPRDAKGNLIEQKPLALVERNNVLTFISNACNGKLQCEVPTTSATLGVEPLASCSKHLKVGYRCFTYDMLQISDVGQSDVLKINCNEAATSAKK